MTTDLNQASVLYQQPRGADVWCTDAMSPSSFTRSYTITIVMAIAIIGQQGSGFTIDRTSNDTTISTNTHSTDLSTDNDLQQQTKEDLSMGNNTKTNVEDNSSEIINNSDIKTEISAVIPEAHTKKTPRIQNIMQTSKEIITTTENTKIPTISSDTVEVLDSVEDVREFKNDRINTEYYVKSKELESGQNVIALATSNNKLESETTTLPTELPTTTYQLFTIDNKPTLKNVTGTITSNNETSTYQSIINDTQEVTTGTIKTEIFNLTSIESTTAFSRAATETVLSTATGKDTVATTEFPTTFPTATEDNTKVSEPSWKKYTNIVRKRITSAEDTSETSKAKGEKMKAETSNTHVNFEKAFNVTPISSLEKLRVELLSNSNQPSSNSEMMSAESGKTTVAIKLSKLSPNTVENTESKGIEIVQSKRGGYLDYSEKASTTVATARNTDKTTETTLETTVDDIDTTEIDVPDLVKVKGSESQSQLAEDAIQEELMKEEALNNHKENVNRYEDEKTDMNTSTISPDGPLINAEDSLSVQPINQERTKTTLYTISPNYKPMKKIDVQPAKPFIRDPDDNSWRNESISSLGIVFKPKNSTISFKEVLKNKTQIELNNLQEKYVRDNLPDLRVRLEKITEDRKTKKKKMNKDGEEVYIDSEEDKSVEGTNAPVHESVTSVHGSDELSQYNTATLPSTETDPEEKTSPMMLEVKKANTMTSQALFKSLGLDSLDYLTTAKPKKFFNIAEYYDTTDEYDADYVTMSKLDLKKFTNPPLRTSPPPKETHQHIEPLINRPIKTNFPERKPTVQYFPPREPQKVSVHNIDREFERKVNLFKDRPKIEPLPPFVTVAPLPIATENPAPEMRPDYPHEMRPYMRPDVRPDLRLSHAPLVKPDTGPTMRPTVQPTDFTMYTPTHFSRNYYLTNAPRTTEPHDAYVIHEGSLNRGSYVIKHYKDLLNAAAVKSNDDDRPDYMPLTESPRQVTVAGIEKSTNKGVDYDYDAHFRKDVLNRFVDNFNQNSERFKVDFPILYNSSVVHRPADEHGRVMASSRAFLKRLYNNEGTATKSNAPSNKPCEPHCDVTVELSPAYELHYYVPEQEEKEEMEPRSGSPPPMPYRYTL